jgi:ATP-binding cassette, subfamily C, bacterial exporter for protease/lipase
MKPSVAPSELKESLLSLMPWVRQALFFSFFTNILVLAPTLYMLEVYDRVVNSRSMMTLVMLTILVIGLYILMETLNWVRSQIMLQASQKFDATTSARVFDNVFEANLRRIPGSSSQALTDQGTLREFIAGPAVLAIMDVPMSMLLIIVVFWIHPVMGWFSIAGALLLVGMAWLNERNTQPLLLQANRNAIEAKNYANGMLRNAQVIESMGMLQYIHQRWSKKQQESVFAQAHASDLSGANNAITKSVQMAQASLLLGVGAWLVIDGEHTASFGLILVASILGARILAPFTQVIGMWRQVVNVRDAYQRLDKLLAAFPQRKAGMPLPSPVGDLSVESVMAGAPGSQATILRSVSFTLPAGESVAIVGPSACGKSTLARLLVGIWPTTSGKVRLDGVDVYSWNKSELGCHIGYLPQGVELFDGTLAENIARFGDADMNKVEAAARMVGMHDMIMSLPQGYESSIGDEGCFLSGGQRQRVGLARAIYGNPRFVVLDEPNSSLDEAGEAALVQTLIKLRAQGTTLVVITHRTNVLAAVGRMLILHEGQVKAYGLRDDVLTALRQPAKSAASAPLKAGK